MTAYRYVRSGRLPARKSGGVWRVSADDLRRFGDEAASSSDTTPDGGPPPAAVRSDRCRRLADRLGADDEPGAMQVVNEVRSATEPWRVHVDLLAPALLDIRADSPSGLRSRRADATLLRLLGRLSGAAQAGPSTGLTVLVTAREGTHDQAGVALVADTFRAIGHRVADLGPHTPLDALASSVEKLRPDVVAMVDSPDRSEAVLLAGSEVTTVHLEVAHLIPQRDDPTRYDLPSPIIVHGGQDRALERLMGPLVGARRSG